MYKEDLALNKPQEVLCKKKKKNSQPIFIQQNKITENDSKSTLLRSKE